MLRHVAELVQAQLRASDIPVRVGSEPVPIRYGGEELVVILPETDLAGAVAIARRIRAAAETELLPGAGCRWSDQAHSQRGSSLHGALGTPSPGTSYGAPTKPSTARRPAAATGLKSRPGPQQGVLFGFTKSGLWASPRPPRLRPRARRTAETAGRVAE